MGHQRAEDAQPVDALLDGDGDLPAELGVLALVGPVLGAVGDGQGVHPGLLDEFYRVQGIGVGGGCGEDVVLLAAQHTQLALHADAAGVGVLDHFPGQLDVLLQGQGGAVDHHGGVAAVNGGHAGVKVLAVVQVEHDGDGGALAVLLHRVGDVAGPLLLVLQRAVLEIHTASHKRVCQVRALQDGGGAEGLVHFNDSLGLCHGVDIERPLSIIVSLGGLHKGSERYQRHNAYLQCVSKLLF